MSKGFFITGTDTDVGKTTVALGIMAALKDKGISVAAMKPVSAGCKQTSQGLRNEDALRLMEQASIKLPYDIVNPFAFKQPIAPHIAAEELGISMEIRPLMDAYKQIAKQADVVIVEGAGGWLVPINERETMADVAKALDLAVIQVIGLRLGCLNHALLTQESIINHRLTQAGWIANQLADDMPFVTENIKTLQQRMTGIFLGTITFKRQLDIDDIASHINIDSIINL